MAYQTPRSYRDLPLWSPPPPTYASMASSGTTTTSTPLGGVSSLSGPPPGFPLIGMPALTDMLPTPLSYNPLRQACVGRGHRPQLTVGSTRSPTPGITRIHHLDMTLRWDKEAAESLLQSEHTRGPLLRYLLAPGTTNLCHEEVINRVLQENYEMHDKAKEKARISLTKYTDKRAKYCQEYDELIKRLDATSDKKLQKDLEVKREVVQTCINKAESSMAKYEDCLEYLWMQEPGAPQDGGDPSDSSEGHSDAVVVEIQEGGGLMEEGSTSNPGSQEAEKPMDVDQDSPSLCNLR